MSRPAIDSQDPIDPDASNDDPVDLHVANDDPDASVPTAVTPADWPSTALCICTHKRPAGLEKLLRTLASLEVRGPLRLVVVDNDERHEGLAVVERLAPDYPWPIRGIPAPQPGISFARNTAVTAALETAPERVAFLDDDEWPSPDWFAELHRVMDETGADAVGGPTLTDFPPEATDEQRANPYYGADMALADGTRCQLQAAGNFMIRAETLRRLGPDFFHPDFAHSGGEDLAFFTRLGQLGAHMAWASRATVHESVAANRLTEAWMRTRVINIANSRVRVMQLLEPGVPAALVRGLKTVALAGQAGLFTLASLPLPGLRRDAAMLRWKFLGKFTAHCRRVTVRESGH